MKFDLHGSGHELPLASVLAVFWLAEEEPQEESGAEGSAVHNANIALSGGERLSVLGFKQDMVVGYKVVTV